MKESDRFPSREKTMELYDDGTLMVKVDDCTEVTRVIVRDAEGIFCRIFYEEGADDGSR